MLRPVRAGQVVCSKACAKSSQCSICQKFWCKTCLLVSEGALICAPCAGLTIFLEVAISGLLGTLGDEELWDGPVGPDMLKATKVMLIKNMLAEAELFDENACKEIAEVAIEKVRGWGSKEEAAEEERKGAKIADGRIPSRGSVLPR